jgi:DNA-binding transcriptional ArsR family regulator
MELRELQTEAGAAESMLKALANRHRLMILCELNAGERSVGDLQAAVGLSQSAMSQHLSRLRADQVVSTRREAQTIYYTLASEAVRRIMALLYELYCAPAAKAKGRKPPPK